MSRGEAGQRLAGGHSGDFSEPVVDARPRLARGVKVRALPEWKKFEEDAAFNDTFMTGNQFKDWVKNAEQQHKSLMQEAGFLAK